MVITADRLQPIELSTESRRKFSLFARSSVNIDIAGLACAVKFNDEKAAAIFSRSYGDMPAVRSIKREAFCISHPDFGALFWAADGPAYQWPHERLTEQGIAFLADAFALASFLRGRRDVVSIHAAVVGSRGKVAAIVGDSHAGKTTTAIACVRYGMDIYSDERCLIANDFIIPFPRAVSVRSHGAELLVNGTTNDEIARRLRDRAFVPEKCMRYGEIFGEWIPPQPGKLHAAFLISQHGDREDLEAIPPHAMIRPAARWAQGEESGIDRIAKLLSLFEKAACYRLTLGSPDASARLIERTLLSG